MHSFEDLVKLFASYVAGSIVFVGPFGVGGDVWEVIGEAGYVRAILPKEV